MSDSVREKAVALELKRIYESRKINSMSLFGIISKIKREVTAMKRILKFKTKEKTQANIRTENDFRAGLDTIFNIGERLPKPSERDTPMEVDDQEEFLSMYQIFLICFDA